MNVKHSQRGFSLLEVACILVLIGLVGLVAVPTMKQIRKQEVACFSKEMSIDLSSLKAELRRHSNDTYTLELIANGSQYEGYQITKNSEAKPMTVRNGTAGFDIKIMDSSGSEPAAAIVKLDFAGGKIKAGADEYDHELKIQIASDDIKQSITFNVNTGYYEISDIS